MTQTHTVLLFFFAVFGGLTVRGETTYNLPAAVTVRVLDEKGNVFPEGNVCVSFLPITSSKNLEVDYKKGKSNNKGEFYTEGISAFDSIGAEVGKYGTGEKLGLSDFYRSACKLTPFRGSNSIRWEPWNPVIALPVRKKLNPVPMFAKHVDPLREKKIKRGETLNFPTEISYDLEKGDFCAPQGRGEIKDLIFTINYLENHNTTVTLKFSNHNDGIILLEPNVLSNCLPPNRTDEYKDQFRYDFQFLGPRYAPSAGYSNFTWDKLTTSVRGASYTPNGQEKLFYVFRVRSKTDEKGNIIEAKYGKIRDGIKFSVNKDGFIYIMFNYHYNPDGTQNLEFDPERNLNTDTETNGGLNAP